MYWQADPLAPAAMVAADSHAALLLDRGWRDAASRHPLDIEYPFTAAAVALYGVHVPYRAHCRYWQSRRAGWLSVDSQWLRWSWHTILCPQESTALAPMAAASGGDCVLCLFVPHNHDGAWPRWLEFEWDGPGGSEWGVGGLTTASH